MEEKFSYNYSADRNEELRKIREKYEIKNDEEQDKLEKIRAMDRNIETPGKVCGIIFGLFFASVINVRTKVSLISNPPSQYMSDAIRQKLCDRFLYPRPVPDERVLQCRSACTDLSRRRA